MVWLPRIGIALAVVLGAILTVTLVAQSSSDTDHTETAPTTTTTTATTTTPTTTGTSPRPGDANRGASPDAGAATFADNCARCHGSDGGGGVGPRLSEGRVAARFPSIDDQIGFVTNTDGNVIDAGQLSAEDIRAVVEYTRGLLRATWQSPDAPSAPIRVSRYDRSTGRCRPA
jgi:mono/diheme cytochrome c family protein